MASSRELEIRFAAKLVIDDRTRAALIALGWTPPPEAGGCTCDQADDCDLRAHGGHEHPHRYVLGRRDPACPEHGTAP